MAIEPSVRDEAAQALLKRITELAAHYEDPGSLEQLANAYALVAGNVPTSRDSTTPRGGKVF